MKDSQKQNKKIVKKKTKEGAEVPQRPLIQEVWFILPVVSLLVILLVLVVYNASLKQQLAGTSVTPSKKIAVADYPLFKQNYAPNITAQSAIIVDDTSKVVLYEKNPTVRLSMASTTKIMTALVGLEHFKLQDPLTIYRSDVEGTVVGFLPGEQIYFKDLLYAMMLPSGNDAAYAIADNYPGGAVAFINRMNEKAAELQLTYTHYGDAAGLDDDGNYTTVGDLARLASYAMTDETLANIVKTQTWTIQAMGVGNTYAVSNLNKLLGQNGVVGIKTGLTLGAGGVLVTAKKESDRMLIIIVMRSEDRFADTEKLLGLITNNVSYVNPVEYLNKKVEEK